MQKLDVEHLAKERATQPSIFKMKKDQERSTVDLDYRRGKLVLVLKDRPQVVLLPARVWQQKPALPCDIRFQFQPTMGRLKAFGEYRSQLAIRRPRSCPAPLGFETVHPHRSVLPFQDVPIRSGSRLTC